VGWGAADRERKKLGGGFWDKKKHRKKGTNLGTPAKIPKKSDPGKKQIVSGRWGTSKIKAGKRWQRLQGGECGVSF